MPFLISSAGYILYVLGFVQLIESVAVADILLMEGSLVNYYKKIAPSESTAQGISKEVIDNFIKSCGKIQQDSASCQLK